MQSWLEHFKNVMMPIMGIQIVLLSQVMPAYQMDDMPSKQWYLNCAIKL